MKALKRKMSAFAEYAHKQNSLGYICIISPLSLFPEYLRPFAAGALMAAGSEIRNTGTGFQVGLSARLCLSYRLYGVRLVIFAQLFVDPGYARHGIAMFMVYLAMTTVLNTRRRLDSSL